MPASATLRYWSLYALAVGSLALDIKNMSLSPSDNQENQLDRLGSGSGKIDCGGGMWAINAGTTECHDPTKLWGDRACLASSLCANEGDMFECAGLCSCIAFSPQFSVDPVKLAYGEFCGWRRDWSNAYCRGGWTKFQDGAGMGAWRCMGDHRSANGTVTANGNTTETPSKSFRSANLALDTKTTTLGPSDNQENQLDRLGSGSGKIDCGGGMWAINAGTTECHDPTKLWGDRACLARSSLCANEGDMFECAGFCVCMSDDTGLLLIYGAFCGLRDWAGVYCRGGWTKFQDEAGMGAWRCMGDHRSANGTVIANGNTTETPSKSLQSLKR